MLPMSPAACRETLLQRGDTHPLLGTAATQGRWEILGGTQGPLCISPHFCPFFRCLPGGLTSPGDFVNAERQELGAAYAGINVWLTNELSLHAKGTASTRRAPSACTDGRHGQKPKRFEFHWCFGTETKANRAAWVPSVLGCPHPSRCPFSMFQAPSRGKGTANFPVAAELSGAGDGQDPMASRVSQASGPQGQQDGPSCSHSSAPDGHGQAESRLAESRLSLQDQAWEVGGTGCFED